MLIFFKVNLFFNTIRFPNKKYSFETENEFMFRSHSMGYFDHFKTFSFPSPLPKNTFQLGDWSKWKIVPGLTEIRFFQINSFIKKPSGDEADDGNGMARSVLVGFCMKPSQKQIMLPVPSTSLAHAALRTRLACQMPGTWPGDSAVPHLLHIL